MPKFSAFQKNSKGYLEFDHPDISVPIYILQLLHNWEINHFWTSFFMALDNYFVLNFVFFPFLIKLKIIELTIFIAFHCTCESEATKASLDTPSVLTINIFPESERFWAFLQCNFSILLLKFEVIHFSLLYKWKIPSTLMVIFQDDDTDNCHSDLQVSKKEL